MTDSKEVQRQTITKSLWIVLNERNLNFFIFLFLIPFLFPWFHFLFLDSGFRVLVLPVLGRAVDWLKQISLTAWPVRSATQIWVALLTGHAVSEICFNQSTALPRTGSTKTRNPESRNRKWNHGNRNGIKNRKIKKFKFLSLSTIQRDFVIVCLCTSFESVTYKDGRLRFAI